MLPQLAVCLGAARRARILKEGSLTLIVYGADESLKWQMRVSSFLHAVRCPAPHLHLPFHSCCDGCYSSTC